MKSRPAIRISLPAVDGDADRGVFFQTERLFAEMRVRVLKAFEAIHRLRQEQAVVIVSHGGVNRILIAWALQMPDNCLFRVAQDYGAINLLVLEESLPRVLLLNYRPG